MARRVDDLVAALSVIAGPDGVDASCVPVAVGDPTRVRARGLRVGVVEGEGSWHPWASTLAAVHRAVAALSRRGAVVIDEALPAHLAESLDITQRHWQRESLHGTDVDRQLRDWDRFVRRLTRAASVVDVVVGPVVSDVAPLDRPLTGDDYVFTLPWSLAGWPAVSVPAGHDIATGLPVAVQVAAPRWHDHVALAVARWLEHDFSIVGEGFGRVQSGYMAV